LSWEGMTIYSHSCCYHPTATVSITIYMCTALYS
jgi:hypothetical protein